MPGVKPETVTTAGPPFDCDGKAPWAMGDSTVPVKAVAGKLPYPLLLQEAVYVLEVVMT